MTPGRPLALHDIIPFGWDADGFLVIFTAVIAFSVVLLVGFSFTVRDKLAGRVKFIQQRKEQLKTAALKPTERRKPERSVSFMRATVMRFKLLKQDQVGKLSATLATAGYRSKDAMIVFTFFQLVMPFAMLFVSLLLVDINVADPIKTGWRWIVPLGAIYFGLKLPGIMIHNTRIKRYAKIRKGMPDMLDLMLICAEAGLSLSATLDRVSGELRLTYHELADELSLTSVEMGLLPDRMQALHHLGKRVDMPEIRGMVNVLVQTEKYGTPIAQALRTLSKEFRTQRMLRAEQKAARLPALMTVPMILFILPTLFIVIIAPAAIKVIDTM